jgi:hypothetical protein
MRNGGSAFRFRHAKDDPNRSKEGMRVTGPLNSIIGPKYQDFTGLAPTNWTATTDSKSGTPSCRVQIIGSFSELIC